MQIGAISSISSIMPSFNPVLAAKPASAATIALPGTSANEASSAPQSKAPQSSPPQSSPAQSAATTHTAHATGPHGGGAGAAASASPAASTASAVEQMIGTYSTTVSGQQYSGAVEESNGVYTVSMQNIPYATATGANEMSAENNLDSVIDELA